MKILVATLYLPYPDVDHGGGQDLFGLLKALGRRHTISVISFADRQQAAQAESLRPYVADLCIVQPAVTFRQKVASALLSLRRGTWWSIGRRADREMREAIASRAGSTPADVLLCVWTQMGRYLDAAPPGVLRVLDEVDVRFLVEGAAGPSVRTALRRRSELRYCRSADLVLTRSERDLNVLRNACRDLTGLVVPPIAHVAAFSSILPEESEPARVLFMGTMSRARNQAAARWLAGAIWPKVKAAHPEAVLRIVGAAPPPQIRSLAEAPGIEVTGWVRDLRSEYARAHIVVAPMRSEAGALNKVIDGLVSGRPVVATTSANAGTAVPPDAIRIADDAGTFAHAIVRLLRHREEWRRVAQAGRRYALLTFDWPEAVRQLERTMLALVERNEVKKTCLHTS